LADDTEDRPVFIRLPATTAGAALGCSLGRAVFLTDVDLRPPTSGGSMQHVLYHYGQLNNQDRYSLTFSYSSTTWVSWHQKRYTNLDVNEARDDGVAVASAGPYANHLHHALDR